MQIEDGCVDVADAGGMLSQIVEDEVGRRMKTREVEIIERFSLDDSPEIED